MLEAKGATENLSISTGLEAELKFVLMPDCPYRGGRLDEAAVRSFAERMRRHAGQAPGLAELTIAPETRPSPQGADLLQLFREAANRPDALFSAEPVSCQGGGQVLEGNVPGRQRWPLASQQGH